MINLLAKLKARAADQDRGATAVEYGLIVALIAAVIIIAVIALGENIQSVFQGVADEIDGLPAGGE